LNTEIPIEIIPVWKNVTPELSAELVDLWSLTNAIPDPDKAVARAGQAICIARNASGAICGVGTAFVRILPRLRQPMYYYRQFFAPEVLHRLTQARQNPHERQVLQDYNAGLAEPESLGVLLELENPQVATHYTRAYEPVVDSTFIGYSPRGLQLRVSYFDGARLLPAVLPQHQKRTAS